LIELSKSNLSIFLTELFLEKYEFSCHIIDELSHNIRWMIKDESGDEHKDVNGDQRCSRKVVRSTS
jgi:hypothetical protein